MSHPPRIHRALNALWTVPKGTQLTRRLPSSAHNWGLPAHMELQGVKSPTGSLDGRPSPNWHFQTDVSTTIYFHLGLPWTLQ